MKMMFNGKMLIDTLGKDYEIVTNLDHDFPLKPLTYYEVVDANANRYSVFVGADLFIPNNEVIKDISGYVRIQGVTLPCMVAMREYPMISDNTNNAFIELESNFKDNGSTIAIKKVVR